MLSNYYDARKMQDAVARGDHRKVIGDMWDEIGGLQMEFLIANGMEPRHNLLDIGCGSLRLGVRAVDYLDPGNYFGTELNEILLDAGYDREIIPNGLAQKLPRSNLVTDGEFQFKGIPRHVDFAIATSVFTHLPFNHIRYCLANLARHVEGPCTFFFTVFTPPDGGDVTVTHRHERGGKATHPHRDPYHYTPEDMVYASKGSPWRIDFLGDWHHPRDQMMVRAAKD